MYKLIHDFLERGTLQFSNQILDLLHVQQDDVVEIHYFDNTTYLCSKNFDFQKLFPEQSDHYYTTVKLNDSRLMLTPEVLDRLNLNVQSLITISCNDNYLKITAENDSCIICGEMMDLVKVPLISDDINECLCKTCISKIKMISF